MKESPKSEIRNPKEGRNPKAEIGAQSEPESAFDRDSLINESAGFWSWGDEINAGPLVLQDGPIRPQPKPLDERTALFGESVIRFAKKIPRNPVNNRLIEQLVGAGTSIGANYCEADDSVSGKEFKQRIGTSRKESKETMFFLRMVAAAEEDLATEARVLWREAKELNLIFGAIWRK